MIVLECDFIDQHEHEFPDDWQFGGASGDSPVCDPRHKTTVYEYYDDQVRIVHTTVVPYCDMEALDYCTLVAGWGFNPVWVSAKRPDGKIEMLPWIYDKKTDEVEYKSA